MDPHSLNEQRCRDLVAAYRRERMPHDRRAAAWARLQDAVAAGDAPADRRRADRRRDLAWGVALAAAAVLVWLFAARGRMSQVDGERDAGSQAAHELGASTDSPVRVADPPGQASGDAAEPAEAPAPAPAIVPPPPPPPRAAAPRAADVPKDMPALDAELALLRAAREALGRGAPAEALAPLGQHAREFPGGLLVEERMLLRAQAECELGRRAEARASAAALVRAFPGSPHARTAAGLCED